MIEIAKIPIINETSVVEARNKVIHLANDLKFDQFTSNKLATITSAYSRISYINVGQTDISVGFSKRNNIYGLKLVFNGLNKDLDVLRLQNFFDELKVNDMDQGFKKIEALKFIQDPYFEPNEEFMSNEREKLTRLSKSELLSDIQRKNEELLKLLDEKEMMVKEIHHRVKNNLMVISSLLNLQSHYIKDKEALGIFKESQSRARSMALIHERLYKSSDLKRINFGEYIRTLATEIFRTYSASTGQVKLNMNVDDLMIDINTTVPLGLMVNEMVSNCMKHAFPDGRKGEINIDFHKAGEEFVLKVKDDGKGFPEDLDFQNTESLGMQLVNSLTRQINGNIDLDRSHGTEFMVTFKEKKYG